MSIKSPINNPNFNLNNGGTCIELVGNVRLEVGFYEYSLKYKESAHILTELILEKNDISKLDTYFFAIAYLYRQSIELILKAIGFKYITELGNRKAFIKDTCHNLAEIFRVISPFMKKLMEKDMEAYNWLVKYFDNIDRVDKESDAFRYPFAISYDKLTKKYSIRPVFDKQSHINLVNFANKMEITYDLLDSLYKESFGYSIYYKDYEPIFLEEGGSYYGQSVVGYKYSSERFHPYVKAYTECAEYLYDKISDNNDLKDTLFIPMCYLYRNSIELALKEILLEECSYGFQMALEHIHKKKHKIFGLWNLIKGKIQEHANSPKDDSTLINVEKYITQLNDIDGSSVKFRYPTDKHLNLHFKKKKKYDIDNVINFFGELSSFLSGVNTMMSVNNEYKAEMESENRSEMNSYYGMSDY